jgi:hypothetical protein
VSNEKGFVGEDGPELHDKHPLKYAQEVPLSEEGDPDAPPQPAMGMKRPGENVHEG